MRLSDLIRKISVISVLGDTSIEIFGVCIDSRQVKRGDVFVAMRGTSLDGHSYIDMAVTQGAAAIICENLPQSIASSVTYVQVINSEGVVGEISTRFFNDPTSKLELVGVTGTNGKTTIATLLYDMFRLCGYKCGLVSTVCNYIDGEPIETEHTTPDAVTLNRLLGRMADEGCKYVFMECSSHAIAQKRIGGLRFAGAIFTNLTRDHLDYHITVDNYLKAKKKFFDDLGKEAFAITNLDDKNGLIMVQNTKAKVLTYSMRGISDYKGKLMESHFDGMLLEINKEEVFVRFIGRFNASNLLAVFGAARMLGIDQREALTKLSLLVPVSGRFESIRSRSGSLAIVDYAHTPDALVNVLTSIQEVMDGKGEIITVVGAGGNRDKGKRPLMAQESVRLSDRVIITSDNPRFEEPQDIVNDMLAGLTPKDMKKVLTIIDRREAIRTACLMAKQDDVILVAGKGHENYQDVKGVKHHFDDKEIIKDIFEQV